MKSFTITLAIFGVLLLLLLVACKQDSLATGGGVSPSAGQSAARGDMLKPLVGGKEYSSETARYSLSFPESWTIKTGDHGVVTGATRPEEGVTVGASVTVFPGSLNSPMSAAEVMKRYVQGMERDGLETTEEHHGEVNGRDAVWVVFDIKSASRRGVAFGTTEGKTAYILTCSTLPERFDAVRPTFEGVLGTFKVSK